MACRPRATRQSNTNPIMIGATSLPLLAQLVENPSIVVDNARSPFFSASSSSLRKEAAKEDPLPPLCFYKHAMQKSNKANRRRNKAPKRVVKKRATSFPSPEKKKNIVNRWDSLALSTARTPDKGDKAPLRRSRSFDDSYDLGKDLEDFCLELEEEDEKEVGKEAGVDTEPRQPRRRSFDDSFDLSEDLQDFCLALEEDEKELSKEEIVDTEPRQPRRRNSGGSSRSVLTGRSMEMKMDEILKEAFDVVIDLA